jgi:hypothetical protein
MINLHFWQMAVARATALLIGVVIGAFWPEIFRDYLLPLALLGVLGSLYVLYVVINCYKKK